MSRLPRGKCPICEKDVALRNNGTLREHYVYLPQREQDPTTRLGRVVTCEGSGDKPGVGGLGGLL